MAGLVPVWEPLAVQVADVALWEASVLGSVADEGRCWVGELAFWRQRLAGVPELLELPTDFVRPAVASMVGGQVDFVVPEQVAAGLAGFARECAVTPFMVVHAGVGGVVVAVGGDFGWWWVRRLPGVVLGSWRMWGCL